MKIKKNNYNEEIIAATALLLSISDADDIIDREEINLIGNIITDFFEINQEQVSDIINISLNILKNSTDIFEFGRTLNNSFTYEDKVDFICCAFEVAYADKKLHFLEDHLIKTVANILNVEYADLIDSKAEIKRFLKL